MFKIEVKNEFDGYHSWKEAPKKVSFLRNKHRHTFIVKTTIEVFQQNREIEFYILKDLIDELISKSINRENCGSCEMIAFKLACLLEQRYPVGDKKYPQRYIQVAVYEDNINGGIYENIQTNNK